MNRVDIFRSLLFCAPRNKQNAVILWVCRRTQCYNTMNPRVYFKWMHFTARTFSLSSYSRQNSHALAFWDPSGKCAYYNRLSPQDQTNIVMPSMCVAEYKVVWIAQLNFTRLIYLPVEGVTGPKRGHGGRVQSCLDSSVKFHKVDLPTSRRCDRPEKGPRRQSTKLSG